MSINKKIKAQITATTIMQATKFIRFQIENTYPGADSNIMCMDIMKDFYSYRKADHVNVQIALNLLSVKYSFLLIDYGYVPVVKTKMIANPFINLNKVDEVATEKTDTSVMETFTVTTTASEGQNNEPIADEKVNKFAQARELVSECLFELFEQNSMDKESLIAVREMFSNICNFMLSENIVKDSYTIDKMYDSIVDYIISYAIEHGLTVDKK